MKPSDGRLVDILPGDLVTIRSTCVLWHNIGDDLDNSYTRITVGSIAFFITIDRDSYQRYALVIIDGTVGHVIQANMEFAHRAPEVL